MEKRDRKTGTENGGDPRPRPGRRKEQGAAPDHREILERADIGIVHLSRDFRLEYVNPKAADMLGHSREDMAGMSLLEVVPERSCPALIRELNKCLAESSPVGFQMRYTGPVPRWFHCSCTSSDRGIILAIQDITERRQAEKTLKESQSRYYSLFENNHAVILLIRPGTGRIVDANPAAVEFYGYTREQLTSMDITEINTLSNEEVIREMERARAQRKRVFIFRHRLASGEVRDVEVYSGPIRVSGETLLYSIVHDITEQKQTQEALKKSEVLLNTVIDAIPIAIFIANPDGELVRANAQAGEVWGRPLPMARSPEEYGQYRARFVDTGRELAAEDWALAQALKERRPVFGQVVEIRPFDGSPPRTILNSASPVMDESGKLLGGVVAAVDMTARRQAEEKISRLNEELEQKIHDRTVTLARTVNSLEEQREVLQTIIDNIPVMLAFYDSSGKVTLVNRAVERVLGWSKDAIRNMDFLSAIYPHPGYRRQVWEYMMKAGPDWRDFQMITRSGDTVHASWFNVRLSDGALIGIGIDVTERRKMEQDLRRLVKAIEQAGEGIVVLDAGWAIEYVNPAYENISGYRHDEVIGRRITSLDYFVDRSDMERVVEHVNGTGKEWSGRQKRVRMTTGEMIDISLTVTPVYGQDGRIANFIEVVRDVTGEVRMQHQLSQNQKLEAIGTLAGGIAHDLKSILTPIVANTEVALMDVEKDHPAHELLQEIMHAARMGTDLVKQIVTFSRQEPQEKRPVAIEEVIGKAVAFLRSALPSTVRINQQLEAGDAVVLADPVRLNQVMINLGTNAGHAMREKGGLMEVRLTEEHLSGEDAYRLSPDLHEGPYVRIVVRDTGEGMDEETMQRIFEPFFTTKKHGEGSGMGLSVVHGIVKDHQGAVTVWSRPGKGSTFSVLLPAVQGGREKGAANP